MEANAALIQPFNDALTKLIDPKTNFCQHHPTDINCQTCCLGKMVQSLHSQKLWPFPQAAEDVELSILQLSEKLKQVTVTGLHSGCVCIPGRIGVIFYALAAIRPLLSQAQLDHFDHQSRKLGLTHPPE